MINDSYKTVPWITVFKNLFNPLSKWLLNYSEGYGSIVRKKRIVQQEGEK